MITDWGVNGLMKRADNIHEQMEFQQKLINKREMLGKKISHRMLFEGLTGRPNTAEKSVRELEYRSITIIQTQKVWIKQKRLSKNCGQTFYSLIYV